VIVKEIINAIETHSEAKKKKKYNCQLMSSKLKRKKRIFDISNLKKHKSSSIHIFHGNRQSSKVVNTHTNAHTHNRRKGHDIIIPFPPSNCPTHDNY
jgi:hypothetical protein